MTMKKSLIALAVSSAVVAPASAQAAEVYGAVNTTFESASSDNGGGGSSLIFNTTSDGSGGGMSDTFGTRFGVTGSEDLGNGLSAGYTLEFDMGTSAFGGGGSADEDSPVSTRLANVSLNGDFGQLKFGTQWGVLYSYAGWNHYRTDGHGGATHYYMMGGGTGAAFGTDLDPSGLRVDNALTYTYGGGGYSSDPFTFSAQLISNDRNEAGTDAVDFNNDGDTNDRVIQDTSDPTSPISFDNNAEDEEQGELTETQQVVRSESAADDGFEDDETVDALILGAQGSLPGGVTVNGTLYQENNTNGREPRLITLGGRWSSGPFYVGGTYMMGDRDSDSVTKTAVGDDSAEYSVGDSPSAFNILGGMDFGGGYSGYVGVGVGDMDTDDPAVPSDTGDMQTFFLQAQKTFSSRTKIYAEFETVSIEGVGVNNNDIADGSDSEEQVLAVGIKHSF